MVWCSFPGVFAEPSRVREVDIVVFLGITFGKFSEVLPNVPSFLSKSRQKMDKIRSITR
jgi:hypothetical protein